MTHHIDIQVALEEPLPVSEENITSWASLTLREEEENSELTIRLVTQEEMIELNHTYRKQNKTTTVLAFPSALPEGIKLDYALLGDVIICPEVLVAESQEMNKDLQEHWALIVIHGVLHLLGYDHIEDEDAFVMQALEIKLLAELGYPNPYEAEGNYLE